MIEPTLELDDIQAHLGHGFGTRFARFLGLKFVDTIACRELLRGEIPNITTMAETYAFRKQKRRAFSEGSTIARQEAVLMAIALSASGVERLGVDLADVSDRNFVEGMAKDCDTLLDETNDDGTPVGWVMGDHEDRLPDVLIILGSDYEERVLEAEAGLVARLDDIASIVYSETGYRRPDNKEHFGFNDGLSQPAMLGRTQNGSPVATRSISETEPDHDILGRPGQPLVWPGQFIFGYASQSEDPRVPGNTRTPGVTWLHSGSFLVFRRLRQDVPAFRAAFGQLAENLAESGLSEVDLMAKAVGRWPDGTPLAISPNGPSDDIAKDRFWINHFGFTAPKPAIAIRDGRTDREVPGTASDLFGLRCPAIAHIRKINPRDDQTDLGAEKTLSKLILRRVMLFEPEYEVVPDAGRGLLLPN